MIVGDAHDYILKNYKDFDFIWSSPPCQSHTSMVRVNNGKSNFACYPDLSLYEEILFLKHFFKGKWVVENVVPYYEPLIEAKKIGRHLFWSNFRIGNYSKKNIDSFLYATGDEIRKWLGIEDYGKNIYIEPSHDPNKVLRNCVHPDVGKYIYKCANGSWAQENVKQTNLF